MKRSLIGVLGLFLLLAINGLSAAATLQVTNGILTGATGVDVNGTLYDVQFVEGSCVTLFSGCDSSADLDFASLADATAAANALLSQVLINDNQGLFDALPDRTFGCNFDVECVIRIPSSVANGFVEGAVAINFAGTLTDSVSAMSGVPASFDTSTEVPGLSVYSRWMTAASVPEPGTFALLSLGVVGIGLSRRKSKLNSKRS